jgi:hypothetical protein
MKNYKLEMDGIYSHITMTNEEPAISKVLIGDKMHKVHNDVFPTFEKAKAALLKELRRRKRDWVMAIEQAKEYNESML